MSEISSRLIDTLNDVSRQRSITKEDKVFIRDKLIFLQDVVDEYDAKTINLIVGSLSKNKLTPNDYSVIIRNKKPLVKIINKYGQNFGNQVPIEVTKSVDDIERELDIKTGKYVPYPTFNTYNEQRLLFDFMRNLQNIPTDQSKTTNDAHYGFLALQWRGIHEQTMTRLQQDFELKKMEIAREIQANELRLRIKDLEFENYKLRKGK